MLGAGVLSRLPIEDGVFAGTVTTIVLTAVLLIGVAVWFWVMARRTRSGIGATIEFPTSEARRAA